jgi:hypothetical protein
MVTPSLCTPDLGSGHVRPFEIKTLFLFFLEKINREMIACNPNAKTDLHRFMSFKFLELGN